MADTKISDLAAVTDVLDTDEFVLARSGATKKIDGVDLRSEVTGLYDAYAYLRDEKAAGTGGGAFTSGAWRTRTLNTEVFDSASFVSLASNQFTLDAGTYYIHARAPGYNVNAHKARLQNVTDASTIGVGSNAYSQNNENIQMDSWVSARVTIAGTKAFELQHICSDTEGTTGFGFANSLDSAVCVYAEVWIWREA